MSEVLKRPLKVLLVEDSEDDAFLVLDELRQGGYEPEWQRVETPEALRQALSEGGWDLILADYKLPRLTGLDAFAIYVEFGLDVPFIIISGTIGEDVAVAAMKAGVHDYLTKGNLARLIPAVERELREAEGRRMRRRAEESLRETQEDLVRAQRIAQLGNWKQDLQTGEFRASEEACRILGVEWAGGAAFTADQLFAKVPRDDQPALQQALEKCRAEGVPIRIEHRIVGADGSERFVREYGESLSKGHGTLLSGAVQDITEYRHLEERFRRSQRLEAIGRLAGGVAHDFNNLLVAIKGYSDMILSEVASTDPLHEPLEQILKAGERASALTRQLLAFSGRRVMRPEVLDLNTLVRDLEKMLRRIVAEDIEIRTALEFSMWPVHADPNQIEQVIMNLVVNAGDAMRGGGVLTINTSNATLAEEQVRWASDLKPGRYVSLSVTDTGTGMTAETKRRIFEPFFTTKGPGEGTGLGLSTVYGIVKQHGGDVSVYSEPGHGSTFRILLPAADQKGRAPSLKQERRATYAGTETILLVEDDDMVRGTTVQMLRRQGYEILMANNGAQALDLSQRYNGKIDLLLTDVVMPQMGGQELADRLTSIRPGLKLVFMSGYPGRSGVADADAPFLQKPFSIQELGRTLREVLDGPGN